MLVLTRFENRIEEEDEGEDTLEIFKNEIAGFRDVWDDAHEGLTESDLRDSETSVAKTETIEWWILWLTLEDQMPNEPVILHRVVVWGSVYTMEYCADMDAFMTCKPLSQSRWTTLRVDALRILSIEWFGADQHNLPLQQLSLRQRASHSNFAWCIKCRKNRCVLRVLLPLCPTAF